MYIMKVQYTWYIYPEHIQYIVYWYCSEFTSAASAQPKDQLKAMVWEGWRLERNTILLTGEKRGSGPRERDSVDSTASWPGSETGNPLLVG